MTREEMRMLRWGSNQLMVKVKEGGRQLRRDKRRMNTKSSLPNTSIISFLTF